MEAIRNFCFDNFELLFVLGVIATGFGIMLFLFLFKSNNIADTKNQILKAMLNNSLDDFLESVVDTVKGAFDQAYEIKKGTDFLLWHLDIKTAIKIIQTFNQLMGSGRDETAMVFKRAFLGQSLGFWVDLYVAYTYPAEDQETCQTLRKLFDSLYKGANNHDLWWLIYQKLGIIENNPQTDIDSASLLREERQRIYEMLKPEKVSLALL